MKTRFLEAAIRAMFFLSTRENRYYFQDKEFFMPSCRMFSRVRRAWTILVCSSFSFLSAVLAFAGQPASHTPDPGVMSARYYEIWNDDVQKEIDARIEKYRKADASVTLQNVKPGTDVRVEQISHEFIFGAHIFNFRQLGTC